MSLVNYTKQFGLEADYNRRVMQEKYGRRLARLEERKENHTARGEDREAMGGLFHKSRARRQYRKADKVQRNINRINAKMNRGIARLNRNTIDED